MSLIKLLKIDQSLIREHLYLEPNDHCYFLGEYAAGQGYQYSEMNQLINNLKKPMDRKTLPEWHYKEKAIDAVVNLFSSINLWPKLSECTWVPMPPSKKQNHPEYDDRLMQILNKLKSHSPKNSLDIRPILTLKTNREAAHSGTKRYSIAEHLQNFEVDESFATPTPNAILIFDDLVTTGAGFKAAQTLLRKHFPHTPIVGMFIARSVWVESEVVQ